MTTDTGDKRALTLDDFQRTFDNLRANAMTAARTSDAYQPAVMLTPDGGQRRVTVLRVRMDSVEAARAKLAAGQVAWVREEDVQAVTAAGV